MVALTADSYSFSALAQVVRPARTSAQDAQVGVRSGTFGRDQSEWPLAATGMSAGSRTYPANDTAPSGGSPQPAQRLLLFPPETATPPIC
jgi:hypothetical protein